MDLFTYRQPPRPPEIILLDYQCTLVANADDRKAWFARHGRGRPYTDWIRQEIYRDWLVPLFEGCTVILITARDTRYENPTMVHIMETLDWLPDQWYFNPDRARPADCKRRILHDHVYPAHGTPDRTAYMALESNAVTRAMYAREHIPAVRVPDTCTWSRLPDIEEA